MFKKRLFAYIVDIIIVGIIASIIGSFISNASNIDSLNSELLSIGDSFIKREIDTNTYINQYAGIVFSLDNEMFLSNLVGIVVSILYFVVYPLYNDGATFGKKICGIKIVDINDNNVSTNALIFRYLFIYSIGVSILSLCGLFVLKDYNYFVFVSILNFLKFLVVIISVFMVSYRLDKRSLPDLIAGTKVIEVEK